MRIHFILLAAGNSRRFGSNKLLSVLNGKPMYRYLTDRLDQMNLDFIGKKIVVSPVSYTHLHSALMRLPHSRHGSQLYSGNLRLLLQQ